MKKLLNLLNNSEFIKDEFTEFFIISLPDCNYLEYHPRLKILYISRPLVKKLINFEPKNLIEYFKIKFKIDIQTINYTTSSKSFELKCRYIQENHRTSKNDNISGLINENIFGFGLKLEYIQDLNYSDWQEILPSKGTIKCSNLVKNYDNTSKYHNGRYNGFVKFKGYNFQPNLHFSIIN